MQASYFTAWKCMQQGAYARSITKNMFMTHMTMIDNRLGFGASIAANFKEYSGYEVMINNNHIYGEVEEISDCPRDGSYC